MDGLNNHHPRSGNGGDVGGSSGVHKEKSSRDASSAVRSLVSQYFQQLVAGCGDNRCANPDCATARKTICDPNTAAATALKWATTENAKRTCKHYRETTTERERTCTQHRETTTETPTTPKELQGQQGLNGLQEQEELNGQEALNGQQEQQGLSGPCEGRKRKSSSPSSSSFGGSVTAPVSGPFKRVKVKGSNGTASSVAQLIQRYFIQLSKGCGAAVCQNQYCASCVDAPARDNTEAALLAFKISREGKGKLCEHMVQHSMQTEDNPLDEDETHKSLAQSPPVELTQPSSPLRVAMKDDGLQHPTDAACFPEQDIVTLFQNISTSTIRAYSTAAALKMSEQCVVLSTLLIGHRLTAEIEDADGCNHRTEILMHRTGLIANFHCTCRKSTTQLFWCAHVVTAIAWCKYGHFITCSKVREDLDNLSLTQLKNFILNQVINDKDFIKKVQVFAASGGKESKVEDIVQQDDAVLNQVDPTEPNIQESLSRITQGGSYHCTPRDVATLAHHAMLFWERKEHRNALSSLEAATKAAIQLSFEPQLSSIGNTWRKWMISTQLSEEERLEWTPKLYALLSGISQKSYSKFSAAAELCKTGWQDPILQAILNGSQVKAYSESPETSHYRLKYLDSNGDVVSCLNLAKCVKQYSWACKMLLKAGKVDEAIDQAVSCIHSSKELLMIAATALENKRMIGYYALTVQALASSWNCSLTSVQKESEVFKSYDLPLSLLKNIYFFVHEDLRPRKDAKVLSLQRLAANQLSKNLRHAISELPNFEMLSHVPDHILPVVLLGLAVPIVIECLIRIKPFPFCDPIGFKACEDFLHAQHEEEHCLAVLLGELDRKGPNLDVVLRLINAASSQPAAAAVVQNCVDLILARNPDASTCLSLSRTLRSLNFLSPAIKIGFSNIKKGTQTNQKDSFDDLISLIYTNESALAAEKIILLDLLYGVDPPLLDSWHQFQIAKSIDRQGDSRCAVDVALSCFEPARANAPGNQGKIVIKILHSLHAMQDNDDFKKSRKRILLSHIFTSSILTADEMQAIAEILSSQEDKVTALKVGKMCLQKTVQGSPKFKRIAFWLLDEVYSTPVELLTQECISRDEIVDLMVDSNLNPTFLFEVAQRLMRNDKRRGLFLAEKAVLLPGGDNTHDFDSIIQHFCTCAQELGESQIAMNFALAAFKRQPTMTNYQTVRLSVDSLHWSDVKDQMIQFLRSLPSNLLNDKAKLEIFLSEGLTLDASNLLLCAGDHDVALLLVSVETVAAGNVPASVLEQLWHVFTRVFTLNGNLNLHSALPLSSHRAQILDKLVACQPELATRLVKLLVDNMATFITAGGSYGLFVSWLVKTKNIFEIAGVGDEWPAYFSKIMHTPAVTRKPNLVKLIHAEAILNRSPSNQSFTSHQISKGTPHPSSSSKPGQSSKGLSLSKKPTQPPLTQPVPIGSLQSPCQGCSVTLQYPKTMQTVTCPKCQTTHTNSIISGQRVLLKQ